jgi:hypothetical protein
MQLPDGRVTPPARAQIVAVALEGVNVIIWFSANLVGGGAVALYATPGDSAAGRATG